MNLPKFGPGIKLSQDDHERINTVCYPGTRQLCHLCDEPTGRCEDDSIFIDELGPLCESCFSAFPEEYHQ